MDTPVGVLISYKSIPQLMACFFVSDQDKDCVSLKQIQGIVPFKPDSALGKPSRYPTRGLPKFHWEKALVDIVEDIAHRSKFQSVEIISAKNNQWYGHLNQGTMRWLTEERAMTRYDKTAVAMDYEFNPTSGNFEKSL